MLGAGRRRASVSEAVLSASWNSLEVPHASGALATSAPHLPAPVVEAHLGVWVATGRALPGLHMQRPLAAALAQGVGLHVPLSETWSAFGLLGRYHVPI